MALHKDVRRQRAFEDFKRRLDDMSPDQIRTMLEERRVRSPERVELAEARLKQREKVGSSTGGAATGAAAQPKRRAEGDGRDQSRAAKTSEEAAAAGAATAARAGEEVPVARQVGRMLGIGLGVASLAALAVFAIRR